MPLSKYDRHFGGRGSARKAKQSMERTYGKDKGSQVFYATVAKRERKAGLQPNPSKRQSKPPPRAKRTAAHRFLGH